MQILDFIKLHWDAILACQQALFVALSLICELFGWTVWSKRFGTWAAMDLGRLVRNAKVKSAIISGSMFVALLSVGCSMSLESARHDGIATRAKASPVAAPASRQECDNLDRVQRYWGYAGYSTGPIAPAAAALSVVPGIGDKSKEGLLITAGVAAAITVFEFAEQGNFAGQWAQQGCGQ